MSTWTINGPVGRCNGGNNLIDVTNIQSLLNSNAYQMQPHTNLELDGKIGPKTIAAIERFQRMVVGVNPDGRVDPGKRTIQKLSEGYDNRGGGGAGGAPVSGAPVSGAPAGDKKAGTFTERINKFVAYVTATHGITIPVGVEFRSATWQHQSHIAHMIKYNSYNSLRPRHNTSIGGRALISFAHLSDASLMWGGGTQFSNFLRDAMNQPCRKTPDQQGWVSPPNEAMTRARALAVLQANGVATANDRPGDPNSGMVAPGSNGCVEPCLCGGNQSRHLTGEAADLGRTQLAQLKNALSPPTDASVDALLAEYNLHRPILAKEEWHIESL